MHAFKSPTARPKWEIDDLKRMPVSTRVQVGRAPACIVMVANSAPAQVRGHEVYVLFVER